MLKRPKVPKFTFRNLAVCILMACWVGICIFISQLALYYIFVNFITSKEMLELPLFLAIYSALMYIVSLLLIVLVPMVFKKWQTNRDEIGLAGSPTWTDIGLAPAGLILYFLLAALIMMIVQAVFPQIDMQQAQNVGFDNLTSNIDLLIGFISLVIIAPIAEEIIFRGWLYGKLRTRISLPVAIFIVSLLFGLLHGQWNVGINVFVMSVILCLQRELTGTIYSGIILHMLKNAIAFYLLYIVVA